MLSYVRALPLLVAMLPVFASAQSVSSGPLNALPVNSSWMLFALALGVAVIAWWGLRRAGVRKVQAAIAPLVFVVGASWLTASTELEAQLLVQFTDPKGETLSLPDEQLYFEVSNSADARLRITNIEPPEGCSWPKSSHFPWLRPFPEVEDPDMCEVGKVLGLGQGCELDFRYCNLD
ncbi:MAG TPA: midcut-by-XrtH protein [Cellvibrionaceae bacterium]